MNHKTLSGKTYQLSLVFHLKKLHFFLFLLFDVILRFMMHIGLLVSLGFQNTRYWYRLVKGEILQVSLVLTLKLQNVRTVSFCNLSSCFRIVRGKFAAFFLTHLLVQLLIFFPHLNPQAVLREVLEKFLPDDVHIRCNGRVRGMHPYAFSLFRKQNHLKKGEIVVLFCDIDHPDYCNLSSLLVAFT